jgi:hybrid cluster-associated redox disulfide protein
LLQHKVFEKSSNVSLIAPTQGNVRSAAYAGGMKKTAPTLDMTVDQMMKRWSASIRVFIDFKMSCVGCPIASFHSVDEASREHTIDATVFLGALQLVAA